ncbi:MAG: sporulation protein YqfD [Clostridia bacterium]|nr:sporulation protein YqfD [Clostridia bacterium]
MLLFRVLNYLSGYRLVSCPSAYAAEAVNLMKDKEVDYWEMRRERGGDLRFYLLEGEWKRLTTAASHIPFRCEGQFGLPKFLRLNRRRIGIPIGIAIFVLLTRLSTMYVWDVTVSGNETMTDAEVIERLEDLGCGIGSYIPSVDFYKLCHAFILENESVSWISVNMAGTTARVELIEAQAKGSLDNDSNGTPSNLVAAHDGVIVRTETAGGTTVVKAGEAVTKGKLLVSGVVDVGRGENGAFVLVRSRAAVFARTERRLEVVVPYQIQKRVLLGRETVKKTMKFFGKTIKLKENSSILPEGCDIIEENRRIVLFDGGALTGGIPLPITIITQWKENYGDYDVTLTEEEALTAACLEMTELFERELADAEILSRTVTVEERETEEGTALVLIWDMTCIEDIAEEIPIGVS